VFSTTPPPSLFHFYLGPTRQLFIFSVFLFLPCFFLLGAAKGGDAVPHCEKRRRRGQRGQGMRPTELARGSCRVDRARTQSQTQDLTELAPEAGRSHVGLSGGGMRSRRSSRRSSMASAGHAVPTELVVDHDEAAHAWHRLEVDDGGRGRSIM